MALQVWLPLNGDLHNQGLNQSVTVTNDSATVSNGGKIGDCYSFGTSTSYLALSKEAMSSFTDEVSVCFWLKILTWNTNYATYFQAGLSGNSWASYIFGLLRNSSNSTCCFTISNGTSASNANYLTPALELNTWYHISLIYKIGHCFIYMNGKLYKDYTTSIVPNFAGISRITLGVSNNRSGYQSNCQINDFRIYDHALSPKEVEDISKALILHYKLDNNGMGNENYWTNGQPQVNTWNNRLLYPNELRTMFARTSASYVSSPTTVPNEYTEIKFLSTREQIDDGGVQLQKMQRYNEDSNGMCPILENLNAGEYFTLSYELYVNSPVNVKFHISKRVNGTATKVESSIFQVSTVNTWTKISQSIQITSDFDKSNITTEVDRLGAVLSIRDILGVTTSNEVVIKVRNIKLERGQEATPWTPARADFGHIDDDVIYDYSGYGNNGTIIGNLTAAAGSPRYDVATYTASGDTNYIQTPTLNLSGDQITLNFWFKSSNKTPGSNYHMPLNSNQAYEMSIHKTGYLRGGLVVAGTREVDNCTSTKLTDGSWHMCTMTYDGAIIKRYVDAVMEKSTAATGSLVTSTYFVLGHRSSDTSYYSKEAYTSDARIYTTALTDAQVTELYNTSMLVDASGNIIPRGLEEV